MPQIWVTDVELAAILRCTAPEARLQTIEAGLARRRCSDGETRVKVPPGLIGAVVARFFGSVEPGRPFETGAEPATDAARAVPAGQRQPLPLAA